MMADDLFEKVAPHSELFSKFERMNSMIAVGRGHIVVKVPGPYQYAAKMHETVTAILASEVRNSLGRHLGTMVEGENKSIVEKHQQRPHSPVYLSIPYCAFVGNGAFMAQMRAMGYQACLGMSPDVHDDLEETTNAHLVANVATHIVIDGDCVSKVGIGSRDSAKLSKMVSRSTALVVTNSEEKHQVVNVFE
jgi:hypothetical protein